MENASLVIYAASLVLVVVATFLQRAELRAGRRLAEFQINLELERQLRDLYPDLYLHLAAPDDEVSLESRRALTQLFVTYGQAWKASQLGLYRSSDWDGLRAELAYWAQRPAAQEAFEEFRRMIPGSWPDDFVAFVTSETMAKGRRAGPEVTESAPHTRANDSKAP